jgi:GGDEF domain-containing protein
VLDFSSKGSSVSKGETLRDTGRNIEAMGVDASDELVAEVGRRFDQFGSRSVGIYRFSGAELAVVVSGVERSCLERMAQRLIDLGEENLIVRGVPVRGTRADLPKVLTATRADAVLVAIPRADRTLLRDRSCNDLQMLL